MKRFLAVVLVLILSLSVCSCSFSFSLESILKSMKAYINGEEVEVIPEDFVETRENDMYAYDVYETYVVITGYKGDGTYVSVPSAIDGLPVERIGNLAFYKGAKVVYVSLPETVKELEENAFYFCTAMESIVLPHSLQKIGDKSFSWCENLKTVALPDGLTEIPAFCFNECKALTSVDIPASIKTIGNRAFSGCTALQSLTFGTQVSSVGMFAFQNTPELHEITLPGGCIPEENAFSGCSESLLIHTMAGSQCAQACRSQGVKTDVDSETSEESGTMPIIDD